MNISKRLLKSIIKETVILINAYDKESIKYPNIKYHNDRYILGLKGRIVAYNELLKHH